MQQQGMLQQTLSPFTNKARTNNNKAARTGIPHIRTPLNTKHPRTNKQTNKQNQQTNKNPKHQDKDLHPPLGHARSALSFIIALKPASCHMLTHLLQTDSLNTTHTTRQQQRALGGRQEVF
jgi:hypothetical protein